MSASNYHCPSCNTTHIASLTELSLIVCRNCHAIVYENVIGYNKPGPARVPEDWSFLQIGSEATYNKNPLTITGRIRLQLRNDYKNFWCAVQNDGSHRWIMESFASFVVFDPSWHTFEWGADLLHAGSMVTLSNQWKLQGEYVEKCEGISYEGAIGSWKLFIPGFFFIQCSHKNSTAVFFVDISENNIQYFTGEKVDPEQISLKNILVWDEWT